MERVPSIVVLCLVAGAASAQTIRPIPAPVPTLGSPALPSVQSFSAVGALSAFTPSPVVFAAPGLSVSPAPILENVQPLAVRPPRTESVSVPAAVEQAADLSALFDGRRPAPGSSNVDAGRLAPSLRENFVGIIEKLIGSRREALLDLAKRYAAAAPDDRKALDERIQTIVDEINVMKIPPGKTEQEIEVAGPDFFTDDFTRSADYRAYRHEAESRLLNGEYIPQFIYAGAATRLLQDFEQVLGRKLDPLPYRMYGLDLWDALRRMQTLDNEALLKLFRGQKINDPQRMIDRLKAVRIPVSATSLGMGPRQVVAYRTQLQDIAEKRGADVDGVMKNQRQVFHINEEIVDSVLGDFEKNNFYGFDRSKVVFIVQPMFKGYRLEDARVASAPESPALPYGHGYAATQLKYPDAFTLDPDGKRRPLGKSFLDTMIAVDDKKRFVMASHRINDATKFAADRAVDLDNLTLSLMLFDKGYGVTIELVGNPGMQKGGNNIRFKGERRSFLIETSNSKGSRLLTALLDDAAKTGAPYNAFRLTSTPGTYKNLLDIGIRYNLRFKGGFFYLESVAGDLTQIPESRSVAIQRKGELIHDFKQLSNLLDALGFIAKQDERLATASRRDR